VRAAWWLTDPSSEGHGRVVSLLEEVGRVLMEVTCRCGWAVRGSEDEVISGIQAHARSEHDLAITPEDIRTTWRVVEGGPASGSSGGQD
jgi:predicted small metal-binding protein